MYPQQPQGYPQAYPQTPQQYPAQPPMPQYPPAPAGYPVAPAYPAQPYPQQYATPAPPAPPGTLTDFFDQRSAGSPSFKFMNKPIGTNYAGFVARKVGNQDIEVAMDQKTNQPQTYKDGRYKYQMKVPMLVQPSAEYPEGQATWYVKGQARDELARAMSEAGAPEGPPEHGAWIHVTLVAHKPIQGMSPQYVYQVQYQRPQGAAPVQAPVAVPQQTLVPQQVAVPQQMPVPQQVPQQYAAPAQQVPQYPQQVPVQQPVMQAPAPAADPSQMSAEQQALLAKLTGGQQPPL